jgi:hypothetical protein
LDVNVGRFGLKPPELAATLNRQWSSQQTSIIGFLVSIQAPGSWRTKKPYLQCRTCIRNRTHRPAHKKDTPDSVRNRGCNTLATTYFRRAYRPTIIGATVFHFRVRDGNGWDHCAMITRWGSRLCLKPGSVDPGFGWGWICWRTLGFEAIH